jgi:hypothetical protein
MNNANVLGKGSPRDGIEGWRKAFDVNLFGYVYAPMSSKREGSGAYVRAKQGRECPADVCSGESSRHCIAAVPFMLCLGML